MDLPQPIADIVNAHIVPQTTNGNNEIIESKEHKSLLPDALEREERIAFVADLLSRGEHGLGLIQLICKKYSISHRQANRYKKAAIEYMVKREEEYSTNEHAALIVDNLREIHKRSLDARKYKESVSALGLIAKIKGLDNEKESGVPAISISFTPSSPRKPVTIDAEAEVISKEDDSLLLEQDSSTLTTESGDTVALENNPEQAKSKLRLESRLDPSSQ